MSADEPHLPAAPTPDAEAPPEPSFLVVGIGASAGGLEAFKEFLEALPPDPGMAFLYVQHLEPTRTSYLREILSRSTRMTVAEARQGTRLEPNHLYVIPATEDMALKDGTLVLSPRPPRRAQHVPADHLFRSLAEHFKGRAVGVILSGGGSDGTLGFQAIKGEGGVTFAQTEKTAKQDSMPRSAIAEGHVDYVLPPGDIARKLLQLAHYQYPARAAQAPPANEEEAVRGILDLLRSRTQVDFDLYKKTTILRRLRRRMALHGLDSFTDYFRLLKENPAEVQSLYQDFLIRVTSFFRDEGVFAALKEAVFPALIKDRSANNPIRIWVAGCATGEEAYSLAICLLEFLGDHNSICAVKILATDINEAALEKARAGIYLDNIEVDVPPERLRRFFARVDGHYQIGKAVRDLCIFSRHNLANDPPFSRLDLISCRNVLIYMDAALQKRILPMLYYGLNPGGFLLLGSSETVGAAGDQFTAVDQKHRIFAKNAAAAPLTGLGLDFGAFLPPGTPPRPGPPGQVTWSALDVQKEADRVVLSRYAPVGVVVDENMTVLQFRGRTGPYLEPAPGLASLDLLKMLREGLLGEVRAALNRAKTENAPVRIEDVPLRDGNQVRTIAIEVIPFRVPPSGVRCFAVLFQDHPTSPAPAPAPPAPARADAEKQLEQLKQELSATREYLQSVIEEHESACEELKSASEELLSANEELQSTNEELQTAKEETQSANEELATLNEELQHRNAELAQANNDLTNLLAAVNLPIVLVSRDLRIRRFTPAAEKVLNLIPTDLGRPLGDIKPNVNVPDLVERIARVIDNLTASEAEIQDSEGHWYLLRIRPYITLDNKIEGASVTLLDIDSVRRKLEERKERGPKDGEEKPG